MILGRHEKGILQAACASLLSRRLRWSRIALHANMCCARRVYFHAKALPHGGFAAKQAII